MPNKTQLIEFVRDIHARSQAAGIVQHKPQINSPDTKRTYARIIQRDQVEDTGMQGVSRASWYVHRGALLAGYALAFKAERKAMDKAQRAGDIEEAWRHAQNASEALSRFTRAKDAEKPAERSRSRSKKLSAPLNDDWQAKAWKAAPAAVKPVVAVLWAVGCRPKELEMGVGIELDDEGNPVLTIPGAKCSESTQAGQKQRRIVVDRLTHQGRVLASMAANGRVLVQRNRKTLSNDLEKLGQRIGMESRLSAYDFRHVTASELKLLHDEELTAIALGHASARSQKRYGHHSRGEGRGAVKSATATTPVRRLGEGPSWCNTNPPSATPG